MLTETYKAYESSDKKYALRLAYRNGYMLQAIKSAQTVAADGFANEAAKTLADALAFIAAADAWDASNA